MLIEDIAGLTGSAVYAGHTYPTKMDTLYYATASYGTDLSQYGQDLAATGSYFDGDILNRTLGSVGEVSVQYRARGGGTSGSIVTAYDGAGEADYYLGHDGGVSYWDTGVGMTTPISESDLGIAADQARTVQVSMSRRRNYQSGSSADECIREIRAHNVTDDTYAFATLYGPEPGITPTNLRVNADGAGTSFDGDLEWVRVGSRFHSMAEAGSDWDGGAENPSSDFRETTRRPIIMDRASGLGDEGQFFGPAIQQAGSFARKNNDATNSPLVNWVAGDWVELREFGEYTTGSLCFQVPQLPNYEIYIPDLHWATLPPSMVNWLHMRSFVSHGNGNTLNVRFVSMNRIPKVGGLQQGPLEPLEVYYSDVFSVSNTAGEWATGSLRIARNTSEGSEHRNTTVLGIAVLASQNGGSNGTFHSLSALAGRTSGSLGSPFGGGPGAEGA